MSSKEFKKESWTHVTLVCWNKLVSDYFNSRSSASKDPIDLRPVLNWQIRRGGGQGRLFNIRELGMLCLQRCTETLPPEQKQKEQPPTTSITTATLPPMKKRKLMAKSTALEDMML